MTDLRLDWCSYDAAKYAVEHWHYSKALPNQKTVRVGVWEEGRFIGVVVFGDGANAGMLSPYRLQYSEGCELVRIALRAHRSSVSRIVAIALRMLHGSFPALRLVVSFADPEHGHIGSIYQAGGWVYAGMTDPADEYLVNGVRMHGRALRSTRSTHSARRTPARNVMDWASQVLDPNIQRVAGSSKHRYLMPLDGEMRARVAPLSKPYPRASRLESEAPGVQSGTEGAAMRPTRSTSPEPVYG